MENIGLLPPEYEAELITLAEQGDPCALGIKQLRDAIDSLQRERETRGDFSGPISPTSLPMHSRLFIAGGIDDINLAASGSENLLLWRAVLLNLVSRGSLSVPMGDASSSFTLASLGNAQEHGLIGEQGNQNISQKSPTVKEEVRQQENPAKEAVTGEDHPYQTMQLVCASIFLLCASAIPAWLTLGIQFISPLVAVMGMIGSVTVYAMSWAAGRELKRKVTTQGE